MNASTATTLGARLKYARGATNPPLSQRALAELVGVDHSFINKVEKGVKTGMDPVTADNIAGALGVTAAWLVEGEGQGTPAAAVESPAANAVRMPPLTIDDETALLSYAEIGPSPFNPRRTFDEASLAELAESILAQGLLQNLVVRKPAQAVLPGTVAPYNLIAGERRWRAIGILIERGVWARDAKLIPCRVKTLDDGMALALALLENAQRENVHPLEEAEAFAKLNEIDPKEWTPARIASAIGVTPRHVQLRIALSRKLDDKVKEGMRAGWLSLAQARELTTTPPKMQRTLAKGIMEGRHDLRDAAGVKRSIERDRRNVEVALFPVEEYQAEIIEERDEETGEVARYFTDLPEFKKRQGKAVEELVAKLGQEWAWAKTEGNYFYPGSYDKSLNRKVAGAVVVTDSYTGKVTVHTGLVARSRGQAGVSTDPAEKDYQSALSAWREKRDEIVRATGAAIAKASATKPGPAKRAFLLAIIGAEEWSEGFGNNTGIDRENLPMVEEDLRGAFGDLFEVFPENDWRSTTLNGTPTEQWKAASRLSDRQVDALISRIFALNLPGLEDATDRERIALIAADLEVEIPTLDPMPERPKGAEPDVEEEDDPDDEEHPDTAEIEGRDTP